LAGYVRWKALFMLYSGLCGGLYHRFHYQVCEWMLWCFRYVRQGIIAGLLWCVVSPLHLSHPSLHIGLHIGPHIGPQRVLAQSEPSEFKSSVTLSPHEAEKLLQKGKVYYGSKQYLEAKAVFLDILKFYPSHKNARVYLALTAYALEDFHLAHRVFSTLISQRQLRREDAFQAGYSAFKMRDWRRCYELMSVVPQDGKTYDISSFYAGLCLFELKKWDLALVFLKRAVILPVHLVESKIQVINELEAIIAQRHQGPPKKQKPTRVLSQNEMLVFLEEPQSYVRFYGLHWNIDATYDPPQSLNPTNYTVAKVELHYPWVLGKNLKSVRNSYHLGLGLDAGISGAIEHLREATVSHGTDLGAPFRESIIAIEGARHDNYMFYGRVKPWVEWGFHPQAKLGLSGYYGGHYGQFEGNRQYISTFQVHPFLLFSLTEKVLAKLFLQGDYWLGLSYGSASKYAVSLQVLTKIRRSYELDVQAASAIHLTERRSYTPLATHSGLLLFRYHTPFWVSLEIGGDAEYFKSYQIWPKDSDIPMRANGLRLGLLGGLQVKAWKGLHASLRYSTSDISWTQSGEDVLSESWQEYAPVAQGTLLAFIDYRWVFE